MLRIRLFAAAAIFALLGCAGSKELPTSFITPGFYRGTLTTTGAFPFEPGSAPLIATVEESGVFEAQTGPPIATTLSHSGEGYVLVGSGVVMNVTVESRFTPLGMTYDVMNGSTRVASGVMTKADLPQFGVHTSVPPAGDYVGEFLVVSNGKAVAVGGLTGSLDANNYLFARASGGGAWIENGFYFGYLQPDGAVSEAFVMTNGTVIGQEPPTVYSFDGTTLVVRFDSLPLEPASAWLIMRQQ